MDDRVKQIVNYHATETTNDEEIVFVVSSATENPVIDFVERNYASASMSIYTGQGQTGVPLSPGVDYEYTRVNDYISGQVVTAVYSGLSIVNALYHDVNLYIPVSSLALYGDVTDEEDINRLQDQMDTSNGGFNLNNGSMNGGVRDYVAYDDGAVDAPVDGTGGSPTVTVTLETASPLTGNNSLLFTKPATDCQGQGFAKDFTIDEGVRAKTTELKFTYKASADYVAGDIGMYLYDIDNDVMLLPSVVDVPVSDTAGDYFSTFITGDGANYRLIWHVQTTNILPYTMIVDKVEVGEFNQGVGDVGRWVEISTGNGTDTLPFTAVNDSSYKVKCTTSVGGVLRPISFNFDITDNDLIHEAGSRNGSGTSTDLISCIYDGANKQFIMASLGYLTPIIVNVEKWISARNINTASDFTEYASNSSTTDSDDTTSFVYGMGGSEGIIGNTALSGIRRKRVQFKNAIQTTDSVFIELYDPSTGKWVASSAIYGVSVVIVLGYNNIDANGGIVLQQVDDYLLDVVFYDTPYGGSTVPWTNASLSGARWRVRKVSNGNMAEVPRMVRAEYTNGEAVASNGIFKYTDIIEDTHTAFDVSTGKYLVKVAGLYLCEYGFYTLNPGTFEGGIERDSVYEGLVFKTTVSGERNTVSLTTRASVGDYLFAESSGGGTIQASALSRMMITRIGN